MITQNFNLNVIPESSPVIVHCDQYDTGEGRLVISLFDDSVAYTPEAGATAIIQGTKPDGHGFIYSATISGNKVTADLTQQMSACAGHVRCQVVITETDGRTGTFIFILAVQKSALMDDADLSETDISMIENAVEEAQQAVSDAQDAALVAENFSEDAEAWAVGERGGVPVGPTDPTYHNNAEYYAQQASQIGSLDDLNDVSIISPLQGGQYLGYNPVSQEFENLNLPDMTNATKGIGKPDGKTTDVSSGTFFAVGVSIPAEVNSGGTQYGANWLYYAGTTEVITPDTKQNYRVTDNGTTKLYYWTGSAYAELAGGGGVSGDYMGLYGMTEIQSSDGQGTTLLDLDQFTNVGNYYCNGKAYISTPHYLEIGLASTTTGTHYSAKFLLYVRKINDAWLMQDLYLIHSTGVKRVMHYQRHAEYANNSWTFGLWRADVDTGSVSPDLSPYSLGNGMYNVLVNNIADGDVLTRVNGKWSNVPINKVTSFAVDLTGWTQDISSQSGTTLYKKQISINNDHTQATSGTPTVDIGSNGVLPTKAEQESYNLLQYVTVDDTVPCLYLYASAIPTTAFYINVEGVD